MRKPHFIALSLLVAASIVMSGCSKKLDDETTPSTDTQPVETETAATEPVETETEPSESETETETEPSETEPRHGPFSTAVVTDKVVEKYGQLHIEGTHMVSENGDIVQLRGMSTYGLNGMYGFVNEASVQTLAEDWGCDIIRLAMYTATGDDNYISDPDKYFDQMCEYVDLCIAQGVYVMIDWHILYDGDPNTYKAEAIDFFSRISAIYADSPNVIYEICNEPNSSGEEVEVDWDNVIKPYAEEVIAAIRANDPDNIVIVGTPNWSQDVDAASMNPLDDENVMYTVHFYAGSHGQDHIDKVQTAIDNGVAVFCTEWGTTYDSGNGLVFVDESKMWLDFFDENSIGWCNWSIGGSSTEASNALRFISNVLTIEEKYQGHWPDEFISDSGLFVRAMLLRQDYVPRES